MLAGDVQLTPIHTPFFDRKRRHTRTCRQPRSRRGGGTYLMFILGWYDTVHELHDSILGQIYLLPVHFGVTDLPSHVV
jgi:hypothetical protein